MKKKLIAQHLTLTDSESMGYFQLEWRISTMKDVQLRSQLPRAQSQG